MSSVTVCSCLQNTPDPARLWAVSSRPSDQQQKKPDGCSVISFHKFHYNYTTDLLQTC